MKLNFFVKSKIDTKLSYLINTIRDYIFSLDFSFIYKLKPDYLLPFSYSILTTKNDRENSKRKFLIDFTTIDYKLGAYLYNFLLKFNKNSSEIKYIWTEIKKDNLIKENSCIFKTLSPIILDISSTNWYLINETNSIYEQVKNLIREISYFYLDEEIKMFDLKFFELSKVAIRFEDKIFQGFEAIFEININSNILNLINKIGIGFKKDYGFGKIEIINKDFKGGSNK
ncbi:MAG: CRISPR-associated endoribonuclease Cas6 [Caldisericia bacterium]